jgi:hypothetical protein
MQTRLPAEKLNQNLKVGGIFRHAKLRWLSRWGGVGLVAWAWLGSAEALEVYVDNTDVANVTAVGSWPTATAPNNYYGTNFVTDNNTGKGTKSFTFTPNVPEIGTYEVYMRWTAGAGRSNSVPVEINYSGGTANLTVNQQSNGGVWMLLGTYQFNAGMSGNVILRNAGTTGYVAADAIKLVVVAPTQNLRSYWKLNETSGTTAVDATGFKNGGLSGNAAWTINGKMFGGLRLDGTNDFVQVADMPEYGGAAFSVSVWFCPTVLDGQARALISKRASSTTARAFSLYLYTGNKLYASVGDEPPVDTGYVVPAINQWYHAAMVFDGSLATGRLKVYVNGMLQSQSQPAITAIPDTYAQLYLGILNYNYGYSFQGVIDEVKIYNKALAASEVNQLTTFGSASFKLTLNASMVTNETSVGDAGQLVDEQTLSGDPLTNNPPAGVPVTKFIPVADGANWYYPLKAIIDLGTTHRITTIAFYDSNGTGGLTFSTGSPFNWTTLVTDNQNSYGIWRLLPVDTQTRYIQVSIATAGAVPPEIVLYGTPLGLPALPPVPLAHTPPTFEKFMGVTSYPKEPLHRQEAVGILREFHDWGWDEGHGQYSTYPGFPNNLNAFAPCYTARNYDAFYQNIATVGLEAYPALNLSAPWLVGLTTNVNNKPILQNSGRDPLLPASYIEHADHLFQYTARYGSTPVTDSVLKLRSDQPRFSGLNKVHYYEDWNEQNKWWEGRDAYFTPYEYAAMGSADADGHGGTMGSTVGIKNADPSALFVMGGMARADLDYIKAMKLWCDYYRSGDFPWDAINVHFYSNDGGGQYTGTVGVSPEAGGLRTRMQAIRDYCNQYLPGLELWVTEFGYDTNAGSPQRAPASTNFTAQEVQAQWLVRSYLELAAAGVDRAFTFSLADANSGGYGRYGSSGLLTDEWSYYQPKVSWWYVYTLKNRLKGLRFEAEQTSGNTNVKVYRFKDSGGAIKAYAVWCPTSNETSVSNYLLTLQGTPVNAALVTMQAGDPDGVRTALTISAGKVTLPNVSERPVFVLVDNNDPDFVMSQKLDLTQAPVQVVNESGLGNANMMIDEQAVAGDPREPNGGGIPSTIWSPGNVQASAYIDLGQVRQIDRIYIRDETNAGNLTIEIGQPGSWTVLKVDALNFYASWNQHVVAASTRYIRFTRAHGGANFSEVVLYGK